MNTQHNLPPITLATNDYNRLLFTGLRRKSRAGTRKKQVFCTAFMQ